MKNRVFGKITSIRIEGITKKYGQTTALHDFNMEIEGGELLILIGPSGSGKTTALKTINRLIEPDQGKIYINGQDIMGFDPVQLRRNIGYVIQQIGLFPHLNIGDNIGLVSRIEKWSREKIDKRVGELLSLVDLPRDYAHRFPHQLSGGQQQRAGLARSLVMDPHLLLMDEPFGAPDPILRKAGSAGGISPPAAHTTVHKPLDLHGSYQPFSCSLTATGGRRKVKCSSRFPGWQNLSLELIYPLRSPPITEASTLLRDNPPPSCSSQKEPSSAFGVTKPFFDA